MSDMLEIFKKMSRWDKFFILLLGVNVVVSFFDGRIMEGFLWGLLAAGYFVIESYKQIVELQNDTIESLADSNMDLISMNRELINRINKGD